MKFLKLPVSALLVFAVVVMACKNKPTKAANEINDDKATILDTATTTTPPDVIVKDSVIAKDGTKLLTTFNNTKGTVTLLFKNETIELKQDTMASGIRYSNATYVYSNWHGQTTLEKSGKKVFEVK